jgi:hypothetical protein
MSVSQGKREKAASCVVMVIVLCCVKLLDVNPSKQRPESSVT